MPGITTGEKVEGILMRYKALAILLSSSTLASAPAMAQDTAAPAADAAAAQPAPETQGIGEIVVTAQKRAENVQKVPIAISAFTSQALRERAVGNIAQLSAI